MSGAGWGRRGAAVLLGAFLLSRVLLGWTAVTLAFHPPQVAGDLGSYESDARALLDGQVAYAEVDLEYPPGSLPVIVAPLLVTVVSYRSAFVALSLALDAAGFVALLRLGRRQGSRAGAWLWLVGVPLLGPLAVTRLDLLPAVATIWACERIAAGRSTAAGAWLGLGAVAKLYPGLLVLPMLAASRRANLLWGAAAVAVLGLLAFLPVASAMVGDVLGYHLDRGLQIESTWATPLLVAGSAGAPVLPSYSYGAHHMEAAVAPLLKTLASLAALAALGGGTWLSWRAGREPERHARAAIEGSFVTLLLLLATGSVFSTQYVLWVLALGAAACCAPGTRLRAPALLLLPITVLSQAGYPFLYDRLVSMEPLAVGVVGLRNALVVVAAVWAAWRFAHTEPSPARATSAAPLPAASAHQP